MAGLVISLKPNENFLVNGALLKNGPKRGQICVGDDVSILRMSDAIHPDEATTPVKRVYYTTQVILSCDVKASDVDLELQTGLAGLATVFEGTPIAKSVEKALRSAKVGRYYSVLCALKPLLEIESEMLGTDVENTASNSRSIAPQVAMSA